jgi:hypothetical protein
MANGNPVLFETNILIEDENLEEYGQEKS